MMDVSSMFAGAAVFSGIEILALVFMKTRSLRARFARVHGEGDVYRVRLFGFCREYWAGRTTDEIVSLDTGRKASPQVKEAICNAGRLREIGESAERELDRQIAALDRRIEAHGDSGRTELPDDGVLPPGYGSEEYILAMRRRAQRMMRDARKMELQ